MEYVSAKIEIDEKDFETLRTKKSLVITDVKGFVCVKSVLIILTKIKNCNKKHCGDVKNGVERTPQLPRKGR